MIYASLLVGSEFLPREQPPRMADIKISYLRQDSCNIAAIQMGQFLSCE